MSATYNISFVSEDQDSYTFHLTALLAMEDQGFDVESLYDVIQECGVDVEVNENEQPMWSNSSNVTITFCVYKPSVAAFEDQWKKGHLTTLPHFPTVLALELLTAFIQIANGN